MLCRGSSRHIILLLMEMALILILSLIFFVPFAASQGLANAYKIPIAGLFDLSADEEIRAAFSYAVSNANKRLQAFQMNALLNKLDMKNSYYIGNRICQLMANGMFAFFATHTMDTIDAIKSFSATFRMPFISPSIAMNTTGQRLGYELYLRPYYAKAILDLMKHFRWNDYIYIYNSDEGLERLQTLMECISMDKYFVRTRLLRVQDAEDTYRLLQRLDSRNREAKRIILDLPIKDCEDLLQRQIKLIPGMMHDYLLVRLSEAALTVDAVSVISRALQRMIRDKPAVFKQTLRNGRVYNNGSQGIDCDEEPPRTFVHGKDIIKAIRELEFIGLTGLIKFDEFGLRRDYRLDVFQCTHHRGLSQIGSWHSATGLHLKSVGIVRQPKRDDAFSNRI